MEPPVVTITTDYGLADGYVAALKALLLTLCPSARLVDITHLVPPQDVRAAAFVLQQAAPHFPTGTVHLAVVDPGVGTGRRPVAIRIPRATLVGPDNGIFDRLLPADLGDAEAVVLNRQLYWLPAISATFHGRDLFAPATAHLAAGASLYDLGDGIPCESLVRLPWPRVKRHGSRLIGEVVHVDGFGNLITNITRDDIEPFGSQVAVWVGGQAIGGVATTYGERPAGESVAYVGSSGYVEVAIVNGSAAAALSVGRGCAVALLRREK